VSSAAIKRYCQLPYRIPFSETDAMGIVHHSNHARYFERGRVELLRLIDLNYSGMVKRGYHLPLTEFQVQFKKPLYFDDLIVVETRISELTRVRMNIEYKIFKGPELEKSRMVEASDETPALVTGKTFHCCVNEKGRPVEMPEDIFQILAELRIP
jgi:acyl-CoA thioester hydrolase